MSEQTQQVLQQLFKAVETDQIKLPTLPEVALKIRQAVEKDNQSAADIAKLLSQDSSLSARLLQLANSPLYRARAEIDNLQMAITRLGVRIVKDLVVMLAIKQAFKTQDADIEKQFKEIWQTSVDVAAVCQVLANTQNGLDMEQAMLAGLIHNIGALPIIELANRQPSLFSNSQNIKDVTQEIQNELGEKILHFWNFPQSLIDVVSQWNNFSRTHESAADYVDIVQAGILHTQHAPKNTLDNWAEIPAISKLGLDPEIRKLDESLQNQLEETRASLI
ncbi:Predicted signal transduction protein [hydrothermal vent metagenome]|uniref:Predicted signal transduction protein n=1 Tax=hydrothermal vent metagenome TaxID=652676 RepID=A0A3B0X8D1_9ZZZZ